MVLIRALGLASLAWTCQGADTIYGIDVSSVVCGKTTYQVAIEQPSSSTVIPYFLRTSGRGASVTMTLQDYTGTSTALAEATRELGDWSRRLSALLARPVDLLRSLTGSRRKGWKLRPNSTFYRAVQQAVADSAPPPAFGDAAAGLKQRSVTMESTEVPDSVCEEFFLLDGRSPVDLPDTWGEAQSSFLSICLDAVGNADACETALGTIFAEASSAEPDASFEAGLALCDRLMTWAMQNYEVAALKPRRLKSSGGGGSYYTPGGTAATNGWGSDTTAYGWSTSSLSSRYASTRLMGGGYSGLVAGAIAGGVVGSFLLRRSTSYWSSTNVDSNCDAADCDFVLGANESLYRDDFFDAVFTTNSYTWPQILSISNITGSFVDNAEICPTPESGTGLYFGLVNPDELEWVDEDPIVAIIAGIAGGLVGLCCLCSCCLFILRRMSRSNYGSSSGGNEAPMAYGNPTVVTGQVVQGTAVSQGEKGA